MPRMDGTGPMGMGARTGRGQGRCSGTENLGQGRGFGGGCRRGSQAGGKPGFRWNQDLEPGLEKEALTLQAKALELRLTAIKQRLGAIEPGAATK